MLTRNDFVVRSLFFGLVVFGLCSLLLIIGISTAVFLLGGV
jgi:hypothetical protein